jgi:uncharacterized protein (DUF1501 family)
MNPSHLSRRLFLKNGALAFAALGTSGVLGPGFLRASALASSGRSNSSGRKVLVCIFQRGAADGLSMLVPYGDPDYYKLRTDIALAAPGSSATNNSQPAALRLDDTFGLHPALAPWKEFFDAGELAILPACGNPEATRSHFEAQDLMEAATGANMREPSGWLNRLIGHCPQDRARQNTLRALALTQDMPRSLQGPAHALAIPDLDRAELPNWTGAAKSSKQKHTSPMADFERLYSSSSSTLLGDSGREGLAALAMLQKINQESYRPAHGAEYPSQAFAQSLRQVAQLIKADVGLEVAFVQLGGWDTHVNQGAAEGALAGRLRELASGLNAFHRDLGPQLSDVLVLTMSEFGRTARQNGNRGTDHGYGTTFFALGGNVRGGRILGRWPGLAEDALYEGRDLAITTDYRNFFAEACLRHLGLPPNKLPAVFPGHTISPASLPGYLA